MARSVRSKVSKRIMSALEATGNYRLSEGRRHIKIHVGGKFVGIAPLCVSGDGRSNGRGEMNVITQIRRAAKEKSYNAKK